MKFYRTAFLLLNIIEYDETASWRHGIALFSTFLCLDFAQLNHVLYMQVSGMLSIDKMEYHQVTNCLRSYEMHNIYETTLKDQELRKFKVCIIYAGSWPTFRE